MQLPSSFTYYGNTFSHIHVSENGYIKFSNSSSSSAGPAGNDINTGQQHGVPLMYLFDAADYDFPGGRPDSFKVPAEYSGTNLSNTLFLFGHILMPPQEKTQILELFGIQQQESS